MLVYNTLCSHGNKGEDSVTDNILCFPLHNNALLICTNTAVSTCVDHVSLLLYLSQVSQISPIGIKEKRRLKKKFLSFFPLFDSNE